VIDNFTKCDSRYGQLIKEKVNKIKATKASSLPTTKAASLSPPRVVIKSKL
jgi:hypothetical protein